MIAAATGIPISGNLSRTSTQVTEACRATNSSSSPLVPNVTREDPLPPTKVDDAGDASFPGIVLRPQRPEKKSCAIP
ncbi:hypothetical protein ACFQVA_40120 [Actinomadura keratinilytica]